jgi:O-antigen ligase
MDGFRKVAYLLLISAVTFELYHTYTRTIWIAFAVCIFIYAMIQRKAAIKGIFLLLVSCFLLIALPLVQSRFSDITNSSGDKKSSLEWRFNLWSQTIGGIKEHPFFGGGLGMYEHKIGVMAHNDILRMAYETGLVVTLLYLFGFLSLLIFAFREMKKTESGLPRETRLRISVCLIIGFLISSLADNMIRSTVIMFYYFTAIMLFLSNKKIEAQA